MGPPTTVPGVAACHALALGAGFSRYGVQRAEDPADNGGYRYRCLALKAADAEVGPPRHGCTTEGGLTVGDGTRSVAALYTVVPALRNARFQLPELPLACLQSQLDAAVHPADWHVVVTSSPTTNGSGGGGTGRLVRNRSPLLPGLASPVGMQFLVLDQGASVVQPLPGALPGASFRLTVRAARGAAVLPTLAVTFTDGHTRPAEDILRATVFGTHFDVYSAVGRVPAGLVRGRAALMLSNATATVGVAPLALAEVILEPIV